MQANAIGALPEAELRRLLQLIGGMDPAALQRAAAACTEMSARSPAWKPA
jgi:hypothetical protein